MTANIRIRYNIHKTGCGRDLSYDTHDLRAIFKEAKLELERREDERDFAAEVSGISNGKAARFLSAEDREKRKAEHTGEGERRRNESFTRLQTLLASNAAYARLYNDTFALLGDAESATDRAIAKAQVALEEAQAQLEQTLSRAAQLPWGTRVFRDARGKVWNERGEPVSDADAASIEWRGDEPAYEQFLEERESITDRATRLEELQGYRVDTLGRIRDRMSDHDNPPSEREMEGWKVEIENGMRQHKIEVNMATTAPVPDQMPSVANIASPDL